MPLIAQTFRLSGADKVTFQWPNSRFDVATEEFEAKLKEAGKHSARSFGVPVPTGATGRGVGQGGLLIWVLDPASSQAQQCLGTGRHRGRRETPARGSGELSCTMATNSRKALKGR